MSVQGLLLLWVSPTTAFPFDSCVTFSCCSIPVSSPLCHLVLSTSCSCPVTLWPHPLHGQLKELGFYSAPSPRQWICCSPDLGSSLRVRVPRRPAPGILSGRVFLTNLVFQVLEARTGP